MAADLDGGSKKTPCRTSRRPAAPRDSPASQDLYDKAIAEFDFLWGTSKSVEARTRMNELIYIISRLERAGIGGRKQGRSA